MPDKFQRARAQTISLARKTRFEGAHVPEIVLLLLALLIPTGADACACGCGVFDVGNLFPTQPGGAVYLEYDYMDQGKNWSGGSSAPAASNEDKDIRTSFYTAGTQYLFASGFGVMAEIPYWDRHFATNTGTEVQSFDHSALGDVRLTGSYSGFSADNSTGVTFGVKLQTGDHTYANFDRDTEIGSGSTDLTFGGYHVGTFSTDGAWRYFVQARYQFAVADQGGYRPGNELNGVGGVSYDAGLLGNNAEISPTLQLIASVRTNDTGPASNPSNSGYSRALLSPGVDVNVGRWTLHAEMDFTVYQSVIGNQLIAPQLVKTNIAYSF